MNDLNSFASISEHWTRHVPFPIVLLEVEVDMSLDNVLVGVEHVDLFALLRLFHIHVKS